MKYCLPIVLLSAAMVAITAAGSSIPCFDAHEEWSECGNLCEDSCDNNCDPSVFLPFGNLTAAKNPKCVPGCYCATNYIRDSYGHCVVNEPGACGNGRCKSVSPNAVYVRCVASAPQACFNRRILYMGGGYNGRCVCATGYLMNSQQKCVKSDHEQCVADKGKVLNLVHLPSAPNCTSDYHYDDYYYDY